MESDLCKVKRNYHKELAPRLLPKIILSLSLYFSSVGFYHAKKEIEEFFIIGTFHEAIHTK